MTAKNNMIDKKTKIVATISDLHCEVDFLRQIHDAGVDVIRLNTAHQSPEETLKVVKNVRQVSERMALLVDTKGPEIRTTKVDKKFTIKRGETIAIKGSPQGKVSGPELLYVSYGRFVKDVPIGSSILIDDGEIELVVQSKRSGKIIAKAKNSGEIGGNKSVNVPGVHVSLPSLSKKDKEYIMFAIKHDLDFIAHSFVRNKHDVQAIQTILDKHKSPIKIIAKIENQEGVDNIDEILDQAYGIMVARGDLAVEIPAEKVPLVQKELIKKCVVRQKPVITATQMLHSMIKNARPTRAEVSDVANAILDGTDAIMLSGETAYGDYALEAVRMMSKIALSVEPKTALPAILPIFMNDNEITAHLARAAVRLSQELDIKEIMVTSRSGFSASLIAAYRGRVPVFVKCFDLRRVREFALTYGVNAHLVKPGPSRQLLRKVLTTLVKKNKLKMSDSIIYLGSDLRGEVAAIFLEVGQVSKYVHQKLAD